MAEPRYRDAFAELLKHLPIPNDALRRINAHLDGVDYQPVTGAPPPDPRDAEIARLRAELEAKAVAAPEPAPSSPLVDSTDSAPVESVDASADRGHADAEAPADAPVNAQVLPAAAPGEEG